MIEAFKNNFGKEKMRVINLPIESIRPNPYQPRKHFDALSLKELSASIEEFGIIQPISVRKVDDIYEIIAGERRYRAAQNVGLSEIPAIIMNADNNKSALMALLENLQREDLCFFEIAEGYQNLIREQGMTQDDLAKKLGKSQSTIANKLRLLRLSPRIKRMIRDFSLTERHARALLNIPNEEQQFLAAQTICKQRLNVHQAEELVRTIMTKKNEQSEQKIKIPTFTDVRIFTNTVKKALALMKESGVSADMEKRDFDWGIEYVIKVKTNDSDIPVGI